MKSKWDQIRTEVIERDQYQCQNCFDSKNKLEVHHKIPRRTGGQDVLENLITYCRKCHKTVEPSHIVSRQPFTNDEYFPTIRIKRSDHKRLTKHVTHEKKIHDIITELLDGVEL